MKTRILTILALVVLGSRPALIHAQAYSEFSVDSMFSVLVTGCPSGTENIPVVNATYENKVIELLNIERISKSLPPLKKADELSRSARYHAWEMCKYQYFNHNSMDSLRKNIICTPANRVMPFYNFIAFAENIAEGQPTPEIVNTNWINSSGHYQNMISPNYWKSVWVISAALLIPIKRAGMKISDSVSMFTRLLSTMKQLRPIPFMSICIFMATGLIPKCVCTTMVKAGETGRLYRQT